MTPEQFKKAEAIFRAACELPAGERSAFAEKACGEDPALGAQVRLLLEHDERPAVSLEPPAAAAAARECGSAVLNGLAAGSALPERIGSYRILEQIGEGGFGVVYLAEQENPRRSVALKVLRSAVASAGVLRRFEYEAQILSRLRHSGIAQIFEAGFAGNGAAQQPFFAMEYIRGGNLLDYADARDADRPPLDLHQRLGLFLKVCAAIAHAHQSGVIHRDLKPDNILVDEHGQPKVLDFGVARLVDSDAAVTLATGAGQIVGTLAYMSPEQVSGDSERIDTRCDVYALGVILYQLLGRRLPYDLSRRSLLDAIRAIREESPPPLGSLDRRLRGDLQAVVGRAMEKEAHRRYPSVPHLAGDIEAYLSGRPVMARSASRIYHLRKLAARHKRLVGVAAAGLVALILGAAGTTWQAVRATHAAQRARIEARKSERINQFLQNMLTSAEPNRTRGREVSVRELLDQTAGRVHDELAHEPEIEAAVRTTLGDTYASLGHYERAEQHLREALAIRRGLFGDDHVDTAATALALARVLRDTARYPEAFELCQQALDTNARALGRENVVYGRNLMLYAGLLHSERPDYEEAERAYYEAIAIFDRQLGRKNPYTVAALGNLGAMMVDLFRFKDGEPLLREACELARAVHGPDHSASIMNGHNLASLLVERNQLAEAERFTRKSLDSALRVYGADHPETARIMALMARLLLDRGEVKEAESLARQALAVRKAALPEGHRLILYALVLLGDVLVADAKAEAAAEAEALAREAIAAYEVRQQEQYWPCAEARGVLGLSLAAQGRFDEAEELLTASYETIRMGQGPRSYGARKALGRLIRFYEAWERPERAAEYRVTLQSLPPR